MVLPIGRMGLLSVFAAWPAPGTLREKEVGREKCQRGGKVTGRELPPLSGDTHLLETDIKVSLAAQGLSPHGSSGLVRVRDV